MRKRAMWWIGVLAAVTIWTTGCSGGAQQPPNAAPQPDPSGRSAETISPRPLDFEVIDVAALPTELASWGELKALPQTTPSARVGDFLYVLVSGGVESIGASAITVSAADLYPTATPTIAVRAEVTPGTTGAEMMTFPLTYVRIPYVASLPVPRVLTQATVQAAPGAKDGTLGDPNQPVSSPTTPPLAGRPPAPPAPEPVPGPSVPGPGVPAPSVPEPAAGAFTPISARDLPSDIASWASTTVQAPQGMAHYVDGFLYLMISAGQRNTGGYSVEITSVELRDQVVHVTARLHQPSPNAMVTQAITYPKAFARVEAVGAGSLQVMIDWR